ncbi:centrosomal protein of 55 kDa-like [Oncorhynchus mykiss]|uniref:TSG101 and ALIX binding domain-containing protein n=1 Tax=Oncorhynchus mykiss TaxID=8022 RepID=A0A8K9UBZ2_ONCMY|nr:centrosomal protein of 55 kDa-like [Oncorhynchus mykiss]
MSSSNKNKDNFVDKTGGRLCCSKNYMEISKLRKENAYLRKSLDELSPQKGEQSDSGNNKLLLEKILSLETLREKNAQQLLARDQEICSLWQQAHAAEGETVAGLQAQIDHYVREADQRKKLFQSLQAETEDVKNKLVSVSAKCQELDSRPGAKQQSCPSDGQVLTTSTAMSHDHLTDALEKNQQWLAYDQQREAYVKVVLARVFGLEQQLNQAKQALAQQHKDAHSEERSVQIQKHYEKLLLTTKRELETQREQVNTAQRQLSELQCRYEEKQREVGEVRQQFQAERLSIWQSVQKEKRRSGDREGHLWDDMEELQARLEEKETRSAELLVQVNLLQKSLLSLHEEQKRVTILEQQIQVSAKDLEDEKRDCQYLQQQLHKVLKELRKAKDHVAKLESEKGQRELSRLYEASAHWRPPAPLKRSKESVTSHSQVPKLLDESFLECPSCRAQYPTRHHRELLAHLEHCL